MAKKIYWDKGHGGTDPGAVANGLLEKTLNHKIVEYAMAYLEKHYTGFEQRVNRTGDASQDLAKRDDAPDAWGADVFVSVHINAGKGTGFETFISNGAGSATVAFQNMMHSEILNAMRKFDSGLKDRGKKRANYFVLAQTNANSILTENLFIDSNDSRHLKNEAFLKAVGEAHAIGVAKYTGLKQKAVSKPTTPKPAPSKPAANDIYSVQIFAGSQAGAERVVEQAKKAGFKDAYLWKK